MAGLITKEYKDDPRPACKYGSLCYQKNALHHEKFKHPGKRLSQNKEDHSAKKIKLDVDEASKDPNTCNQSTIIAEENVSRVEKVGNGSIENIEELAKSSEAEKAVNKVVLENDHEEVIKQLFLVKMPQDFYSFWDFCKSLNKDKPENALKEMKIELVGAYDVLAGKIKEVNESKLSSFLRHWRYYYDPPEMQTVLRCDDSRQYHLGYFRDEPSEDPVFVASNYLDTKKPERNGIIRIMGGNLFAAVNGYLEGLKEGEGDPFRRMKVPKIQKALVAWAQEKGFSLSKTSQPIQAREKKVVTRTFHGAGLVVPVNKKMDTGYRELAETDVMIKKILKSIVTSKSEEERNTFWAQLQPVITFANIANDECDFGTSLELGLDLFTYGSPLLHRSAKQLLTTAYLLLGRSEFAKIVEAHLEDRRTGIDLSVL